MDFRTLWSKFRGTLYFRFLILTLVALLAAFVLQTGIFCFVFLTIPVMTFLIPYWFGERNVRNHALNGLFVLLVASVLFALLITPAFLGQDEFVLEGTGTRAEFADGRVTPFRTAEPREADFNFTVNLTSDDAQAANFLVQLRVLSFQGLDVLNKTLAMKRDPAGDGNFTDGEGFFSVVRLPPQAHSFSFQVLDGSQVVLATGGAPGPFNASFFTYFILWWYSGFFTLLIIMVLFYLVLLLYWWSRKSRAVRQKVAATRKRDEGGGEFTCTNCGGDVGEADTKCPNCGAVFESGATGEAAKPEA